MFLLLVGVAGWGQSEYRHPCRARAHGKELDGAFPTRLYGLPKPFQVKAFDGRSAPCTRLVRVYASRYSTRRCGGDATVTYVLQLLEGAGVAGSSNGSDVSRP
jgi:hypothetical protein